VLTARAPELEQGCCSYGAHLVDEDDANAVLEHADRLTAAQWQYRRQAVQRGGPIRRNRDGVLVTRLVGEACIFLNRPGFPGGAGCALHRAALEAASGPSTGSPPCAGSCRCGWWRPPTSRRAWSRPPCASGSAADWGAGGHDFAWWCTDAPDAFSGGRPVYEELRDEIVEMVGPWAYDRLVEYVEARDGSAAPRGSCPTPRYAGPDRGRSVGAESRETGAAK
jgi:hypothetical protein